MSKRTQSGIAVVLAVLGVVALAGVVYLAFVFPKTIEIWAGQGRALSAAERAVMNLSSLCKSFGRFLIPALFAGVIGCGVWAALAARGTRQETANN